MATVYIIVPEPITSREAELARQVAERDGRLADLEKENALLRQKIDLLVRKLFGAKSEQLDPAQLLLLLQGFDEPGAERSETDCRRQPEGWSGGDIKNPGACGRGGSTEEAEGNREAGGRASRARRSHRLRVSAAQGCPSICR